MTPPNLTALETSCIQGVHKRQQCCHYTEQTWICIYVSVDVPVHVHMPVWERENAQTLAY